MFVSCMGGRIGSDRFEAGPPSRAHAFIEGMAERGAGKAKSRTAFHDKEIDAAPILTAKKWISDSESIFILGYGFDKSNNARIEIDKTLMYNDNDKRAKDIYFTNFGNNNVVNNAASEAFFDARNRFRFDSSLVSNTYYYERSVRDVYEALSLDFGL